MSVRPAAAPSAPSFDPQRLRRLAKLLRRRPLRLVDYYRIGIEMEAINDSMSEIGQTGTNWRKRLAEKLGVSDSTLGKCLQFRRRYEKDELSELENLKIGWAHLSIAFSVHDKRKRHRLLERARQGKWGQRDLQREIQRIHGRCRGGGRPRKEPTSRGLLADVLELTSLSKTWNEFYAVVFVHSSDNSAVNIGAHGGIDALRMHLEHCADTLKDVREKVAHASRTVKRLLGQIRSARENTGPR